MAEIMVNFQGLSSKKDELQAKLSQLTTKKSALQQTAGSLRSMWEGDAQAAFTNAVNTDVEKITEFENAIRDYINRLGEIIEAYNKAEQQNADIATKRTY